MLRRQLFRAPAVASTFFSASSAATCVVAGRHFSFVDRHIGPTDSEFQGMLKEIHTLAHPTADAKHFQSIDAFARHVVPDQVVRKTPMPDVPPLSEAEALGQLRATMSKNKQNVKSLIGQGYFEAVTPPVIQRNILENPAWYTPYTPYQAEIAQGRLESLLNYQTVVTEITGMQLSNASLLDEAGAAAEAMNMSYAQHRKKRNKYFISANCFKQTLAMVESRAQPFGIEVVVGDPATFVPDETFCGMLVQTPDRFGAVRDFSDVFAKAHEKGLVCTVGTDLLAQVVTKPVAAMGADIAFGNGQRFGIPLGYGGPHPAFFAFKSDLKRIVPGRIIGVSKDDAGNRALRMALQTREQHIRREHATSNICTAQALLANMVAMYAVYHGRDGLTLIAQRVHQLATVLAAGLEAVGAAPQDSAFFDTVTFKVKSAADFVAKAAKRNINVFAQDDETISISVDEATNESHILALLECAGLQNPKFASLVEMAALNKSRGIPASLTRASAGEAAAKFLAQPVFNSHRSESSMMRYIASLHGKDYGLQHGMIPLGSCTMKLNPAATMLPLSWPEVSNMHPLAPANQAEGYRMMILQLEERLRAVSGLDAVSLQPNSGAQGEFAGLRVIRAYYESRGEVGDKVRDVCVIPANAHGTNPASAALAGFKCVTVKCLEDGQIDIADLKQVLAKYDKKVGCAMITYPSTYGMFDENILEVTDMIHASGGQVYIDGANFNAMVGYTGPGFIGGDVCHFNLHKTFSIPHGGGGPGMGPICVREHLAPFLPNTAVTPPGLVVGGKQAYGQASMAPYGSASILNISAMLVAMLGSAGTQKCTAAAIVNANYMAAKLAPHYPILFRGKSGCVAHEFILDLRRHLKFNVTAEDVAKRLMDYGFHAPTLAFPVPGTLMVEPTESETKAEMDRFIEAMVHIREEIREVEEGKADKNINLLKKAPHTVAAVTAETWDRPYSRERAAFPVPSLKANSGFKYWPSVGRVDGAFGDLNLHCCASSSTDDK